MKAIKRSGRKVNFESDKIKNAIISVFDEVREGLTIRQINHIAEKLTEKVVKRIKEKYEEPHVEQIQDIVEDILIDEDFRKEAKAYIRYREKRKQNRKQWIKEKLPLSLYTRKYQFDGESFEQFFDRVANGNSIIRKYLKNKLFVPAGRILANRGLREEGIKITYSNCYVTTPPEDNLESIFETAKKIARTFSYGGGTGIELSKLRPQGAVVRNSAKTTSGPISFIDIFDSTSKVIGQKGRRAALMLILDCNHPDIESFIDLKRDLEKATKANLSIKVDNNFMRKVENDELHTMKFEVNDTGEEIIKEESASKIFNKFAHANWQMAEPGLLFWDRIENWNLLSEDDNFEYGGTNPCGEEPLPPGGSCLLGAVNLDRFVKNSFTENAEFDFPKFNEVVEQAVIYLNDVLEEGLKLHPLKEQRESVYNWKQIGLGLMGIADMFIRMRYKYGEKESIALSHKIGFNMINKALQTSAKLAKYRGSYPKCDKEAILASDFIKENATKETKDMIKKYGLRNSQLLTIAPTGSISNLMQVSGGIEPIFKVSYRRKTESLYDKEEEYEIFTPIVEEYMEKFGIKDKKNLPDFIVDAHNLDYEKRIEMQSTWQKYIDASISSTINLPEETTVKEVKDLYLKAWKKGLKGVTIFRNNCQREAILTGNEEQKEKHEMTRQEFIDQGICPDCYDDLVNTGGCIECRSCGFSGCTI